MTLTLSVPFVSCFLLWLVLTFIIGRPEKGGSYGGDFLTPLIHLLNTCFWLMVWFGLEWWLA